MYLKSAKLNNNILSKLLTKVSYLKLSNQKKLKENIVIIILSGGQFVISVNSNSKLYLYYNRL